MVTRGIIFDLDNTLIDTHISEQYRAKREWNKVFQLIRDKYSIDSYMLTIINRLKDRGVKISVVSNSPLDYCNKALSAVGLSVDYVIGYQDTVAHKPDPEPIYMAKALMGQPDIVVGVGDEESDIYAYREAGVHPILFTEYNNMFTGQYSNAHICRNLSFLNGTINSILFSLGQR